MEHNNVLNEYNFSIAYIKISRITIITLWKYINNQLLNNKSTKVYLCSSFSVLIHIDPYDNHDLYATMA